MKYLVAVDLSEASLLALDALKAIAGDNSGDVTLLHVVDLDLYTAGGSVPGIMEFAKERLARESERLAGCGLVVSSIRVEQGDSTQTILRVAAEEASDLIVMTNLGKGARTGRLFGSTAERVAAAGSVPVLIERVGFDEGNGGDCCRLVDSSSLDRLLFAVDIDEEPTTALAGLSGLQGIGQVRVVHVVREAEAAASANEQLGLFAAALPVEMSVESAVLVGDPVKEILREAADWGATAIALRPCAHSALHRAVWGSVARAVAFGAACSILFVASKN